MTIAFKESYESLYRFRILKDGFGESVDDIKVDCESIVRILVSIVKSSKE